MKQEIKIKEEIYKLKSSLERIENFSRTKFKQKDPYKKIKDNLIEAINELFDRFNEENSK